MSTIISILISCNDNNDIYIYIYRLFPRVLAVPAEEHTKARVEDSSLGCLNGDLDSLLETPQSVSTLWKLNILRLKMVIFNGTTHYFNCHFQIVSHYQTVSRVSQLTLPARNVSLWNGSLDQWRLGMGILARPSGAFR